MNFMSTNLSKASSGGGNILADYLGVVVSSWFNMLVVSVLFFKKASVNLVEILTPRS
jgi:hypothetical protein